MIAAFILGAIMGAAALAMGLVGAAIWAMRKGVGL